MLNFKEPSFEALFHLGNETAVIIDEKSAADEATNPVGTGPYKLSSWTKGSSLTLDKWDGYRDAAKIPAGACDLPLHLRSVGGGRGDAGRRHRRHSRTSHNVQALGQFKSDPRFQVLIGGTEGKTILAMNNKKKPLDDLKVRQAIAYAIDRKAIIDGAMDGLGAPIGSHLTPNDPGYVDLTGMYPHDPAKAKALLKEAGVTTPLELSLILPPPAYARQGGRDHRRRARRGRDQRQDPEGRVGAVAERRLQGQELRSDHHQPRRAARHRHLRQSELLFPIRQPGVSRHQRQDRRRRRISTRYKAALGEAQKKIAEDSVNAFLFQLPNVTVADAKLKGLWKNAPIFGNDLAALSWQNERTREGGEGLRMQPFRMSALELLSAYRMRELSPVEAMASVIERVEAYEPHIHATWLSLPNAR